MYDPDLIRTVSESVFLVVHTDQDCGICLREMIDLVDRISTEFETPIFAVNRSGENQFTGQKLVRLEYEHLTQKSQILNVHPNLQITSDGCPGGFYGPGKGKRPRSMKCIGCWLLGIMSYTGTSPNRVIYRLSEMGIASMSVFMWNWNGVFAPWRGPIIWSHLWSRMLLRQL